MNAVNLSRVDLLVAGTHDHLRVIIESLACSIDLGKHIEGAEDVAFGYNFRNDLVINHVDMMTLCRLLLAVVLGRRLRLLSLSLRRQ